MTEKGGAENAGLRNDEQTAGLKKNADHLFLVLHFPPNDLFLSVIFLLCIFSQPD